MMDGPGTRPKIGVEGVRGPLLDWSGIAMSTSVGVAQWLRKEIGFLLSDYM